ncbi:MAG: thiamine diphosphokinase [Clostridiaceae bacterium]|jgi:thiamine pyrophosphokinase|nr:thiamine diphosphokinase [Clostridiaceae bacterium]
MDVLVVGSGNMESVELLRQTAALAELLICVDGGARYFQKADITPHVLLGDFDSIEQDTLRAYETEGVEVVRFSPRKDYTDMELALNYAVEHGATRIFIMGATGSRVDHSISNVQLLHKLLDADVRGIILDDKNRIYLIKDKITIGRMEGYKLSLVPATPVVEGIVTEGLVWPLFNYTMKMGAGIGISNEFSEDKATVRIGSGRMYVILSKD